MQRRHAKQPKYLPFGMDQASRESTKGLTSKNGVPTDQNDRTAVSEYSTLRHTKPEMPTHPATRHGHAFAQAGPGSGRPSTLRKENAFVCGPAGIKRGISRATAPTSCPRPAVRPRPLPRPPTMQSPPSVAGSARYRKTPNPTFKARGTPA